MLSGGKNNVDLEMEKSVELLSQQIAYLNESISEK